MKRKRTYGSWARARWALLGAAAAAMAGGASVASAGGAGATASPPQLTITSGPYHNAQKISVSVGPNKYFAPYSRINIIECADPGGSTKNLPTSVTACDGNTVQGNTILVQRDGSFSEHGYQVFALPNRAQLGEDAAARPACSQKKMCVLYVGQNQEKFTAPKVFSTPFTVSISNRRSG